MSMIASDLHGMDGLAQMQAILRGDLHALIGRTLDFDLIAVARGRVEFEGASAGPSKIRSGPCMAAMPRPYWTRHAAERLTRRSKRGRGFTTLELKVAYHRPITEASGPVRCEGKLVSRGRRVAYTEGRLTDAQGKLCATATSTLLIFALEPAAAN